MFVRDLFNDLKDGIILLKVLDRIEPGCVNWKMVEKKSKKRPQAEEAPDGAPPGRGEEQAEEVGRGGGQRAVRGCLLSVP